MPVKKPDITTIAKPDMMTALAGTIVSLAATGAVAALTARRGGDSYGGITRYLPDTPSWGGRESWWGSDWRGADWRALSRRPRGAWRSARDAGADAWQRASDRLPALDVGDWMPSRMPGMLPAMLAGGAVVAGLAAVADHIYRPAQLTPSKDSALPERTATGALAVLALGLAAGAVAAYASEPEPKRGLARWFG